MKRLLVAGIALLLPLLCQSCNKPANTGSQPNTQAQSDAPPPRATQVRTDTSSEEYLNSILKVPLSELEAEAKKMEKQLEANPDDPELKLKAAEAIFKAGYAMMMAPELAPRVKYRGALKYFRRTLALNPNHKHAAESKQTIEDIYKQMGRPIPE